MEREARAARPVDEAHEAAASGIARTFQNIALFKSMSTLDNIMSRTDSEAIVRIVDQVHPGRANYLQIEGMAHDFTVDGKLHDPVVTTMLDWMKKQLAGE